MDIDIWNSNIAIKQEEEHKSFIKQIKICATKKDVDYNAFLDHVNNWFFIHIMYSDLELWKKLKESWFDERRYVFKKEYLELKDFADRL